MERLYSPKRIKEIMDAAGINFNKNLGQNFLIDGNIVRRIVKAADVTKNDVVLEIGPGIGTLTEELLMNAKKVISVEIDNRLIPILEENFKGHDNFVLIHGDAMKVDFSEIISEHSQNSDIKVIANLPYYITTPIMERLLTEGLPIKSCTFMVQKEVAERITAKPSSKEYGSLTLFISCFADAEIVIKAPKEVFMPQPKVDSIVIYLKRKEAPEGVDVHRLTEMIHLAFQQRRKNVINAFQRATGKSKDDLRKIFDVLNISHTARAENLSLDDFIAIERVINERSQ